MSIDDAMNDEDTAELIGLVPAIRRYTLFLTRYNVQDADDLLQDTLVRAFENGAKQYKQGTNFKAWVMRIAHNRFMDICRRASTRSDNQQKLEINTANQPVSLDPFQNLEFKEMSEAFEELPDKYRRTLFLVAVEQFNYSEAATILDLPIGTVKSRVARARKALKDKLASPENILNTSVFCADRTTNSVAHSDNIEAGVIPIVKLNKPLA